MIKDVMGRDMINEISTLFVMIFTSGHDVCHAYIIYRV